MIFLVPPTPPPFFLCVYGYYFEVNFPGDPQGLFKQREDLEDIFIVIRINLKTLKKWMSFGKTKRGRQTL